MDAFGRLILSLATCAVVLVTMMDIGRHFDRIRGDDRRLEELGQDTRAVLERIHQQHEAIADLLAGKRTLLQTAGVFRTLSRQRPAASIEMLRRSFPGDSEEEVFCRQVLAYAHLDASPAVETALQREFHERRLQGTLRFSDSECGAGQPRADSDQ